jgi:outer membrane protein TolC
MNRRWEEAGLQLSFNLFNLISGPDQVDLAKAGVALADQRRLAMQMSVLTQVHLARIALINARSQFTRADAIYNIDSKIDQLVKSREAAQAQSKLETVSNVTTTILSLLRRYQALAQVQVAENRLMATLGIEPKLDDVGATPLPALTAKLRAQGNPWVSLTQPTKP